MSKNILLIGSQGFLGSHVKNLLDQNHENYQEIKNKKDVDIRNLEELDKFVMQNEFKSIINCSAFVGGIAFGYKYQADLLQINSLMAVNIYEMAKNIKLKKLSIRYLIVFIQVILSYMKRKIFGMAHPTNLYLIMDYQRG